MESSPYSRQDQPSPLNRLASWFRDRFSYMYLRADVVEQEPDNHLLSEAEQAHLISKALADFYENEYPLQDKQN